MNSAPKYNFPWELITDSLSGTLSDTEKLQLQEWLASDPANKERYARIRELWENGMEDYTIYQMANENNAWDALKAGLAKNKYNRPEKTKRTKQLRILISVAAVFLGLVGLWFILTKNNPSIYETASGIQKKIMLNDGTTITLSPNSRIEISSNYNKTDRTVYMTTGEAYFNVKHQDNLPFIVDLKTTRVLDIGTHFTIQKGQYEIKVSVASGKVNFIKLATREHKELIAGSSITYNLQNESFSAILPEKLLPEAKKQMLSFKNAPLSDVIISIRQVYGKKIRLADSQIARKKITAQLDGMSYDTVMQVICKSLGLEFAITDSVYILKDKHTEQP